MRGILKLLAFSSVLAALGTLFGGCSQIPADQRIGLSWNSPIYGVATIGYASGAAAVAPVQPLPVQGWTLTVPAPTPGLNIVPAPK